MIKKIDIFVGDIFIGSITIELNSEYEKNVGSSKMLFERIEDCVSDTIQITSIESTFQ